MERQRRKDEWEKSSHRGGGPFRVRNPSRDRKGLLDDDWSKYYSRWWITEVQYVVRGTSNHETPLIEYWEYSRDKDTPSLSLGVYLLL